jgi:threonylcarbamoyladenosine tRNA methylthiotransferase MtaB
MKTISFYTLGCRLNQSETAVIQNSFADGFRIVGFDEPADIVVINTCTVTENSDHNTRYLVHKASRLNPKTKIALVGCQAQIQKEKLTKLPNVRWVVGNAMKMDLKSIVKDMEGDGATVLTPAISRESFTVPFTGIDPLHKRANIKIQDGCDFFCSFCEIPYARGRARSRFFEDLLKESEALVKAGHKEIVITGINVGTYFENNKTILDVIDSLEKIDGLQRIRISSIEPTTVPDALIEKMSMNEKLCRYLHLPLQSASPNVLKNMKRKYTLEEYDDFIKKVRTKVKDVCIGTDVIVGFPGETEEEFQKTYDYLLAAPIDYFHVFSYSNRNLAKAKDFETQIPTSTINQRSECLRGLSQRKRRMFYESLKNSRQHVLFEKNKDGLCSGVTDHFARVFVKSKANLINQIHPVVLLEATDDGLWGELL